MDHDSIRPAEHISHSIAWSTRNSILWPGIFACIIAASTLAWTIFHDRKTRREEKEKREAEAKQYEERLTALGKRLDGIENSQELHRIVHKLEKQIEDKNREIEGKDGDIFTLQGRITRLQRSLWELEPPTGWAPEGSGKVLGR